MCCQINDLFPFCSKKLIHQGELECWGNLSQSECFRLCRMRDVLLILLSQAVRFNSRQSSGESMKVYAFSIGHVLLTGEKVSDFLKLGTMLALTKHFSASKMKSILYIIWIYLSQIFITRNHNSIKCRIRVA